MADPLQIVAFYFPGSHPTPRMNELMYEGWTEWDMLRAAKPHYPGHYQPRVPLWGYEDESVPSVMQRKISAAVEHGIDVFQFLFYWYDDEPFWENALDRGFLGANPERTSLRFAINWANHDIADGFPEKASGPNRVLWRVSYSPAALDRLFSYWIEHYFSHPAYWRLSTGELFLSVHRPSELVRHLGGVGPTRRLLTQLRKRVAGSGLGDLHINTSEGYFYPSIQEIPALGLDSTTNYCVLGYRESRDDPNFQRVGLPDFSSKMHLPYAGRTDWIIRTWEYMKRHAGVPYFPVVTVGRDCTPRVDGPPEAEYIGRFGNRPVLDDATPDAFRQELKAAVDFLDRHHDQQRLMFINSWNEWTEGAYLEPDERFGYGHLREVRQLAAHVRRTHE